MITKRPTTPSRQRERGVVSGRLGSTLDTFEARQARSHEQQAIGDALADATYDRGGRLTEDERFALVHWVRFGSDGYPIRRLGRKWTYDSLAAPDAPLYRTKRDAVRAWEILIAKWIRLDGLEAHARAIAAQEERERS